MGSWHLISLLLLSFWGLRRLPFTHVAEAVVATFLLTWSEILATSFLLAAFNSHSSDLAFGLLSLGISGAVAILFSRARLVPSPNSLNRETSAPTRGEWVLMGLSVVIVAGYLVLACVNTYQVEDALAMKMPNAYFYWKNANLIAPRDRWDEVRAFSTPFNGSLLWSYFLRVGPADRLILLCNFIVGCLSFVCLVQIPRHLGVKLRYSWQAALLFCTNLVILFQMSTDNDDLLSSFPCFVGILFFLKWSENPSYWPWTILSALGFGVSLGCKSFPMLYAPALLVWGFWKLWTRRLEWPVLTRRVGPAGMLFSFLVLAFCFPYFLSLKLEYGRWLMTPPLVEGQKILHHSLLKTGIIALTYFLSMTISPWVDLLQFYPFKNRVWLLEHINSFYGKYFNFKRFPDTFWSVDPVYLVEKYIYDHNAWFGFYIFIVLAAVGYFLTHHKSKSFLWGAIFWLTWFGVMSTSLKFIQGIARYWILMMGLSVPFVAAFLESRAEIGSDRCRHFWRRAFIVVMGINLYFGWMGLTENPVRADLKDLAQVATGRESISLPLPRTESFVKEFSELTLVRSLYGWPFFAIIDRYRDGKYYYKLEATDATAVLFPGLADPPFNSLSMTVHHFLPDATNGDFFASGEQLRHADLYLRPPVRRTCHSCAGLRRGSVLKLFGDVEVLPQGQGFRGRIDYEFSSLPRLRRVAVTDAAGREVEKLEVPRGLRKGFWECRLSPGKHWLVLETGAGEALKIRLDSEEFWRSKTGG